MTTHTALLKSIQSAPSGLTLAERLAQHPSLKRRTVQRWLGQWVAFGHLVPEGKGRARRYLAAADVTAVSGTASVAPGTSFPANIPLSADSQDILAYVTQSLQARKPVGRQLHKMGKTSRMTEPAGTYSRAILNRLLIDLSWASSHLEGNTYSRLDTVELIEHGRTVTGKGAIETQMILNHKTAIELLVDCAGADDAGGKATGKTGLSRYLLMNLPSALAENLLP